MDMLAEARPKRRNRLALRRPNKVPLSSESNVGGPNNRHNPVHHKSSPLKVEASQSSSSCEQATGSTIPVENGRCLIDIPQPDCSSRGDEEGSLCPPVAVETSENGGTAKTNKESSSVPTSSQVASQTKHMEHELDCDGLDEIDNTVVQRNVAYQGRLPLQCVQSNCGGRSRSSSMWTTSFKASAQDQACAEDRSKKTINIDADTSNGPNANNMNNRKDENSISSLNAVSGHQQTSRKRRRPATRTSQTPPLSPLPPPHPRPSTPRHTSTLHPQTPPIASGEGDGCGQTKSPNGNLSDNAKDRGDSSNNAEATFKCPRDSTKDEDDFESRQVPHVPGGMESTAAPTTEAAASTLVSGSNTGKQCPICGNGFWGLNIRARQDMLCTGEFFSSVCFSSHMRVNRVVRRLKHLKTGTTPAPHRRVRKVHINSCLDGKSWADEEGEDGNSTAPRRPSTTPRAPKGSGGGSAGAGTARKGIARQPKTEFQEDIHIAKALSRSLVTPISTPTALRPAVASKRTTAECEEPSEESHAQIAQESTSTGAATHESSVTGGADTHQQQDGIPRYSESFEAKERRLLDAVKEVDAKIQRLGKERELALKRLAAHRALGARMPVPRLSSEGDLKTTQEVVDKIFTVDDHPSVDNDETRRTRGVPESAVVRSARRERRRKRRVSNSVTSASPLSRELSPSEDTHCTPVDRPVGQAGGRKRGEDVEGNGTSVSPVTSATTSAMGLLRRRSTGGRFFGSRNVNCTGIGTRRRSLWSIAQDAGNLSQSNFVTEVLKDFRTASATGSVKKTKRELFPTANITAASYGDASMYNRRTSEVISSDAAQKSITSAPAALRVDERSPPRRVMTSEDCIVLFDESDYSGSERPGENEDGTPSSSSRDAPFTPVGADRDQSATSDKAAWQTNPSSANSDKCDGDDEDYKLGVQVSEGCRSGVDEIIQKLSQVLSQGGRSWESTKGQLPPADEGQERVEAWSQDGNVKLDKAVEDMIARHISRGASLTVVSTLFPNWQENVQFVFRQDATELRDALCSLRASLHDEIASTVEMRNGDVGGEEGKADEERSIGIVGPESAREKVEALEFFEGVISEALGWQVAAAHVAADQSEGILPEREDYGSGSDCTRNADDDTIGFCSRDVDERDEDGIRDVGSGDDSYARDCVGDKVEGSPTRAFADEDDHGSDGGCRPQLNSDSVPSDRDRQVDDVLEVLPGSVPPVNTDDDGGLGGGLASSGKDGIEIDGKAGGDDQEGNGAASSATEVTGSASDEAGDEAGDEVIILSGDSCRDAIMAFDLSSDDRFQDEALTIMSPKLPRTSTALGGGSCDEELEHTLLDVGRDGTERVPDNGGVADGEGNDYEEMGGDVRNESLIPKRDSVESADYPWPDEFEAFETVQYQCFDNEHIADFLNLPPLPPPGSPQSPQSPHGISSPCKVSTAAPSRKRRLGAGSAEPGLRGDRDMGEASDSDESFSIELRASSGQSRRPPRLSSSQTSVPRTLSSVLPGSTLPRPPPKGPDQALNPSSTREPLAQGTTVGHPPGNGAAGSSDVMGDRTQSGAANPSQPAAAASAAASVEFLPSRTDRIGLMSARRTVSRFSPGLTSVIGDHGTGVNEGGGLRERMPDYERMTTQELAGMMSVYGLKKKSKREMVVRLQQIWRVLHPHTPAPSGEEGRQDSAHVSSPRSDIASGSASSRAPAPLRRPTPQTGCEASSRNKPAAAAGRVVPPHPPESRATNNAPQRELQTTTERDESGASSPRPTPVRRRNNVDRDAQAEQIREVLTRNTQLYEDILLLQTVDITAVHLMLKDAGVKCSKRDLCFHLDELSVTHIDRGGGLGALRTGIGEGGGGDGQGKGDATDGGRGPSSRRRA